MRTLTFVFSDLRGYTEFVERHGDVAATTLIADYRRLVRAEVAKAKGAEIKTEGDSFYVVFDAATDAVRCAISILREAHRYSRDRPDRPMRVGIGIHAGEPQPHEGQYVGGAVIVAARLAQQSLAGELLVTEVVRGLLPKGALPRTAERDGLVLKGIADAPRVHSVTWTAEAPPPRAPRVVSVEAAAPVDRAMVCPRVIGRTTELEALRTLLEEAGTGRGRLALVSGEAGVGKSAFLRLVIDAAVAMGVRVLTGECTEVEARRPFGPFIDAFAAASVQLPAELASGGPGALSVAEVERYRVHAGFAQKLAELAQSGPVMVAVEDVHWADGATLELLPYLARKLRDRRVLLLGTYRDDELHRLHPLRGTLAELKRGRLVTEVHLPTLTSDEVAAMIQETLRLRRAPTTAFREAIVERCEGNPFFIEEVLRALVESGELEYRDGAWQRAKDVSELAIPDSVRDAVQQRLATITPAARRVLQVAAVVGQRFTFDVVRRVTSIGERDLLEALREGIDAQLIHEEQTGDEEWYRFRHALTRESVLAELMRRERKLLHLEVADAIEAVAGDAEARAEELAYHSDKGDDDPRAYRYHEIAARQAERAFAFQRAIEHLERAVELAPRGDPALGRLQLRLAGASGNALESARALRAAEGALAAFEAAQDARGAGEALSLMGAFRRVLGDQARGDEDIAEAVRRLEPLGDSRELAVAYGRAAWAAMLDLRPEAAELGRKAIATSAAVGDDAARVDAMITTATAAAALAPYERPRDEIALLREAVALARGLGMLTLAHRAYNNLNAAVVQLGAPGAEREAVLREWLAYGREQGVRVDHALIAEAFAAFGEGDWDRVLWLAEEGRGDAYFSPGRERLENFVQVARLGPEAGLGRSADLERRSGGRTTPQDIANRAGSAASLHLLAGDPAQALARAAPLAELTILHVGVDLGITAAMAAALRLGDREAAAGWAVTGARRRAPLGHGSAEGCRAFAEGVQAWLAGDAGRALERYGASASAFEEHRAQYPVTLARQLRAEIIAARGDPIGARAELEIVLPFWRKAKATWFLGQLRAWAAERGIELTEAATATTA